jgi:hypothetical protein
MIDKNLDNFCILAERMVRKKEVNVTLEQGNYKNAEFIGIYVDKFILTYSDSPVTCSANVTDVIKADPLLAVILMKFAKI